MKTSRASLRLTIRMMVLVSYSTAAAAQGLMPQTSRPSVTSIGSESFSSATGGFTISLPSKIRAFRELKLKTSIGIGTGESYAWDMAEGAFFVGYIEVASSADNAGDILLETMVEQFLDEVKTAEGRLTSKTEISVLGLRGKEFKVERRGSMFTMRLYSAGHRVYESLVVVSPSQLQQEGAALQALDSFRLLTVAEVDAILKKKVADATPAPLPQQPLVPKPRSDAQDEGLKGNVKVVRSEAEDPSVTSAIGKRKPASTAYFDRRGNLLKNETFDFKGNLMHVTVYGYIDGERVSNSKSVRYEYDPPPPMPPPGAPESKRDQRYSLRFKYTYDADGRLAEEQHYGNDGKLLTRYVYRMKGNEKEELGYSSEGSLNQRYVSKLDERGNVIEWTDFDVKAGTTRSTYSYKYEFDSKDNWIKRTTSKLVMKDGKSNFEPTLMTYRTIEYY